MNQFLLFVEFSLLLSCATAQVIQPAPASAPPPTTTTMPAPMPAPMPPIASTCNTVGAYSSGSGSSSSSSGAVGSGTIINPSTPQVTPPVNPTTSTSTSTSTSTATASVVSTPPATVMVSTGNVTTMPMVPGWNGTMGGMAVPVPMPVPIYIPSVSNFTVGVPIAMVGAGGAITSVCVPVVNGSAVPIFYRAGNGTLMPLALPAAATASATAAAAGGVGSSSNSNVYSLAFSTQADGTVTPSFSVYTPTSTTPTTINRSAATGGLTPPKSSALAVLAAVVALFLVSLKP